MAHPVNGGISFTPDGEDYCPHRALAASVITRAILDYCEARAQEGNPQQMFARAERERALRVKDQQRTRDRRIANGSKPFQNKEIESASIIAEKWLTYAATQRRETVNFLFGKTDARFWFHECNMPYFTQKKLNFCYNLHAQGSLSQAAIEEFTNAKILRNKSMSSPSHDTERQVEEAPDCAEVFLVS